MGLPVLLSVGLSPEVAQTKQTAVFMKQGRATRVFCLVVHFSTHTHTHPYARVHTPQCPALLIFYLPCSVAFPPLVFSAPLSPPLSWAPPPTSQSSLSFSDCEECHSA